MTLPLDSPTIAKTAEPLYFGIELRSCGGCGSSYTAGEGECPQCGPRGAKPRWFDAPAPFQMPQGVPAPLPAIAAEVLA